MKLNEITAKKGSGWKPEVKYISPYKIAKTADEIASHLNQLRISGYELLDDGSVDAEHRMLIIHQSSNNEYLAIKRIPINFNKLQGVYFTKLPELNSLIGCPKYVNEISLIDCDSLKSFKYFPLKVTSDATISGDYVKSLSALSNTEFTGNLTLEHLHSCESLKGLEKLQNKCGLYLHNLTNLKSLKGLTANNLASLTIINSPILKSLVSGPKIINGDFALNNVGITSLKFGPEIVRGDYTITRCDSIDNLEGLPHQIAGDLLLDIKMKPHFNILQIFDIVGITHIDIDVNEKIVDILNRWYPTKDIAKAQQELEKAGFEEWAEY